MKINLPDHLEWPFCITVTLGVPILLLVRLGIVAVAIYTAVLYFALAWAWTQE